MMTLLEKLTQALEEEKVPLMIELASDEAKTRVWALVTPKKVVRRNPSIWKYAISIIPVVDDKIGLNRKGSSLQQPETFEELVQILEELGAKVETATEFSKDSSKKLDSFTPEGLPLSDHRVGINPSITEG